MDRKYLELLKYEQALNVNGKSLSIENEPDYIKLITYEINFFDHFKWKKRNQYFSLITNLLEKRINIDQYITQLFKLENEIQNLVEELKLDLDKLQEFEPNLVSKGFSKPIADLCSDCRIFEPDSNLREDYELSETQIVNNLREIFLQIQEYA